jgi:hypothetical protein
MRGWIASFCVGLALLAVVPGCRHAATFPSEGEVRQRIHTGMSSSEVIATFGEPTDRSIEPDGHTVFYYFAPSWLKAKSSGLRFIGFEVHFDADKVSSWSPTQGT